MTELLRILREREDAPLTEPRDPSERFVGTCRDFALLMCSLLRATGTPARIRCGFATYFDDGFHEDHWVTEYRLPDGSWRLVDAQVAARGARRALRPAGRPTGPVPGGGRGLAGVPGGATRPATFGVSGAPGLQGPVVRARQRPAGPGRPHGVEVLPWDGWGPEILDDADLTEDDLALIDAVADARSDGRAPAPLRGPSPHRPGRDHLVHDLPRCTEGQASSALNRQTSAPHEFGDGVPVAGGGDDALRHPGLRQVLRQLGTAEAVGRVQVEDTVAEAELLGQEGLLGRSDAKRSASTGSEK